jgi:hypothetical protein
MSSSAASSPPPMATTNLIVNLASYGLLSIIYLFGFELNMPRNRAIAWGYLIGMFLVNWGLTYWLMSQQCVSPNIGLSLWSSLLTWGLLFVPLFWLLENMYAWLEPFGNTFGYLIIKLMGVVGFMNGILKPKTEDSEARIEKYIDYIRYDPWGVFSMLTVNPDAPKIFRAKDTFDNLKPKLIASAANDPAIENQFIKYVQMKENVAKFVFYLVTLNLMTDLTAVIVMENSPCEVDSDIIAESNRKHKNKHKHKPTANATVYKTTE